MAFRAIRSVRPRRGYSGLSALRRDGGSLSSSVKNFGVLRQGASEGWAVRPPVDETVSAHTRKLDIRGLPQHGRKDFVLRFTSRLQGFDQLVTEAAAITHDDDPVSRRHKTSTTLGIPALS